MVEVKIGYKTVDLPYTIRLPRVTEEMFDELVDEDTKAELIDRVMVVHSPATLRHERAGGFLRALASFYAATTDQGEVFGPDALVHLGTCREFAPDLFFLLRRHVPDPLPKVFEGTPDWVAEILSLSTRAYDLDDKRPAYREAGVKEIWFADLDNRQILIDRKRGRGYVEQVITGGKVYSSVLKGYWIDAAWLWAKRRPNCMVCLQQILRGN